MQCFRLSHAGVVLVHNDSSLLIDPGSFSTAEELNSALRQVPPPVGLVITHEHPDHWTSQHVDHIRQLAPDCPIFTTQATARALEEAAVSHVRVVAPGDKFTVGPFALQFYGGTHEVIHSSIPRVDNLGVRVNHVFAYGGDSLEAPPFVADILGIPIGSPWSNIGQIIDFVLTARPRRAYLTHDAMLSPAGHAFYAARVLSCLEAYGGELLNTPPPTGAAIFPTAL